MIYHDLGLQFKSPFIDLWIGAKDFLVLAENFENFIKYGELIEDKTKNKRYPCAILKYNDLEISMLCIHYKTYDDFKNSWHKRKKRIDFDNLYFIYYTYGENLEDIYNKLKSIKNLLILNIEREETRNSIIFYNLFKKEKKYDYDSWPNFSKRFGICKKLYWNFNYVKWFNGLNSKSN